MYCSPHSILVTKSVPIDYSIYLGAERKTKEAENSASDKRNGRLPTS